MSIECGECERDLRGGHADTCSRRYRPWEGREIVVEKGAAHYEGDRWLYAGPGQEIGHVSEEAPGGADAWAKMFKAAPAMARALLAVYEHDKRFRENPEDANRSPIEAVIAALKAAGVPLP